MKKYILNPISMFVIGLALGVLSRLLDIHTQNLGNIFSRMTIWILSGVLISIYSSSKKSDGECVYILHWYVAWMAKEKGIFPKIISIGIVVVTALSSIVFFDDYIIIVILVYYLLVKKIRDK